MSRIASRTSLPRRKACCVGRLVGANPSRIHQTYTAFISRKKLGVRSRSDDCEDLSASTSSLIFLRPIAHPVVCSRRSEERRPAIRNDDHRALPAAGQTLDTRTSDARDLQGSGHHAVHHVNYYKVRRAKSSVQSPWHVFMSIRSPSTLTSVNMKIAAYQARLVGRHECAHQCAVSFCRRLHTCTSGSYSTDHLRLDCRDSASL